MSDVPPIIRDEHGHGFGYRKDAIDRRDFKAYRMIPRIDALPQKASTADLLPEVLDQGPIGACVGYSGTTLVNMVMKKNRFLRPFLPSPVFGYLMAREIGGYPETDEGAEIRNYWIAAKRYGFPPMSNIKPSFKPDQLPDARTWEFPEKSIWRRKPAPSHFADGERRQALKYVRLEGLPDALQSLADGNPVQFGFPVFNSFYGRTGPRYDVPYPGQGDYSLGGHAVVAYAYDMATRRILIRNSWGPTAHEGKPDFTLSFDFYARYAMDAWTCSLIEGHRVIA
jgi:hypothetical protein